MHALITGVAGLVGNGICEFFLKKGHQITALYNQKKSDIVHANFTQLHIDLLKDNIELKDSAIDMVIHCAAIIPGKTANDEENELLVLNQKIDRAVFSFCMNNKIKLIYFSTAYMYSNTEANTLLSEEVDLAANLGDYYLNKKNNEEFLISSNLNFVVFRISSPYGDISKQNNVMKLFFERFKNSLSVTLIGKGERKQNFIHIEDIAEACNIAALKNIKGVFNLTYKESYTMFQLASFIKEIQHSKSDILFDLTKKDNCINVNFDISKLKNSFNWEPKIDLKAGLLKSLNS